MYKKEYLREIAVIISLVGFSTLVIFIFESKFYFDLNESLSKKLFFKILFWSFIKSFIIDSGLIILHYINKRRQAKGKPVI